MKKTLATICLVGSTIALSACASNEKVEDTTLEVPYTMERTATHEGTVVEESIVEVPRAQAAKPAEKVFQRAQMK